MFFERCIFAAAVLLSAASCADEVLDPSAEPPLAEVKIEILDEVRSSTFGDLRMYKHVPADLPPGAPLVVALHGCSQSAIDYVATGWNDLADRWGFAVMYAEKPNGNRCFSWFERDEAERDSGEAGAIKSMVDRMVADHGVDESRIFVTGLSAGGAMSAVMLATYPDVFSAGAVMAGVPHHCATSSVDALACMYGTRALSQAEWAALVSDAHPGFPGPFPRVSIWQGAADYTVRAPSADALVAQWTGVHGLSMAPTVIEDGLWHEREIFQDVGGSTLVERWTIDGMGHGTSVDPANGCGRAGAFVLDTGICSTLEAASFFGLRPDGDDSAPFLEAAAEQAEADAPAEHVDFVCEDHFSSNYTHEREGRGYLCASYVCARGSDQPLGFWNVFDSSWVRQLAPDYFEKGRCEEL